MDTVINGEVSKESAEKTTELTAENDLLNLNDDSTVCKSTKNNTSMLSSTSEASSNNLTNSESVLPHNENKEKVDSETIQKNGDADNLTKQANCTESNNFTPVNDISKSEAKNGSDISSKGIILDSETPSELNSATDSKDGAVADSPKKPSNATQSDMTETQSDTTATQSNMIETQSDMTETQSDTTATQSNMTETQSDTTALSDAIKTDTSTIDATESSSVSINPNSVQVSSNTLIENNTQNDIALDTSPANSLPQSDSLSKVCNKDSEVSLSENNQHLEKVSSPKPNEILENITPISTAIAEQNNSVSNSESKTSNLNSNVNCEIPESNPLEQLNEHLKSIGSSDDMHNYSLSKTSVPSEVNGDIDKSDPSKTPPSKDAATPADRHKESDSFVFTEISEEETGFPNVFTDFVTIGKYISVKGDFTLRSSEALVESPSLIAPYLLKEPDSFPPRLGDSKLEQKDFFHSAAGEMLIGIGLSRVTEWFHRDMTRIKKRQMKKEGKSPELEENLKMHETFYNEARKANKIYSIPSKSCATCGFATESSIVLEGHLLIPHITQRREYQCNYCEIVNRDSKAILEHMYRVHGKLGRTQPPLMFFECPYCTFESNSKVKLGNHFTKCQRFYDPVRNQAPPKDFEFPALTPKPITVAVVKAYEKSLSSMQRGRGRPKKIDSISEQLGANQFSSANHSPIAPNAIPPYRPVSTSALSESLSSLSNQIVSPIQMPNMNLRPAHSNMGQIRSGLPPMHLPSANRFYHVVNSSSQIMPMMGNSPLVTSPSQFSFSSNLVNSAPKKVSGPTPHFLNSLFGSGLRQQNSPKSVPEVTITPLPKLQGPYPVPIAKPSTPTNNTSMQSNSLVVCEICDGYIKDLEQLRSHMQLIHKVKIHPKMLVSRPPLNCQKCQWRFFTDQGLERHLLGAHGLVTSNMQELANKSKDAGCCTICGRVYASKLVSHMNQVHKLTLKPAHLSYKCTVCSATFNLYRLFENHVYLVHSGAAKRPADGSSNPSKKFKLTDNNSDLLFEGEPKNHVEKRTDESIAKCSGCGCDFRRNAAQTNKCEKCLNLGGQGTTLSSKMS